MTPGPDASTTAASNQITAAPSSGLYTPYLTFVLPNTTVVSALLPRPSSTRVSPMATPVVPLPQTTQAGDSTGMRSETQKSDANSGRVDFERLKFRLVFILWPALVGITMAL